jgi:hypothetical protein
VNDKKKKNKKNLFSSRHARAVSGVRKWHGKKKNKKKNNNFFHKSVFAPLYARAREYFFHFEVPLRGDARNEQSCVSESMTSLTAV